VCAEHFNYGIHQSIIPMSSIFFIGGLQGVGGSAWSFVVGVFVV
jgi:hypothetical protein